MKIACCIVTYNRLELLKRCVSSVEQQTFRNFDIVVVNNGSTDGTTEWLAMHKSYITINQANVGGAGGFCKAMTYSYNSGYDWMWLMDDDGVAEEKQLSELVSKSIENGLLFTNALVCNIDSPKELSFGLNAYKSVKEAQAKTLIVGSINPFNGTFINRKVVDKIGFIKKEMFIWGDEMEYMLRAQKNNITVTTVTTAIHFHPPGRSSMKRLLPFVNRPVYIVEKDRIKYAMKNHGYIFNKYYGIGRVLLFGFEHIIFYLFRLRLSELCLFIKYYTQGIRNKY